jgi:hypothetical protein
MLECSTKVSWNCYLEAYFSVKGAGWFARFPTTLTFKQVRLEGGRKVEHHLLHYHRRHGRIGQFG